jgi:hypothetical protein
MILFLMESFEIEISINAEEIKTKTCFKIHIDTDYMNVQMNMLPQPTKMENLKSIK